MLARVIALPRSRWSPLIAAGHGRGGRRPGVRRSAISIWSRRSGPRSPGASRRRPGRARWRVSSRRPVVLPAIERAGLTSQTRRRSRLARASARLVGLVVGRLVGSITRPRGAARRGARRSSGAGRAGPLEERCSVAARAARRARARRRRAAGRRRRAHRAPRQRAAGTLVDPDRRRLCPRHGQRVTARDLAADPPRRASRAGGPTPVPALALPLDAGTGPSGRSRSSGAGELRARPARRPRSWRCTWRWRSRTRGSPFASGASPQELEEKVGGGHRAPARARPGQDRVPLGRLARAAHAADRAAGVQRAAARARRAPRARPALSRPHPHRGAAAGPHRRASCSTCPGSRPAAAARAAAASRSISRELIERNVEIFAAEHARHRFDWSASGSERRRCRADPRRAWTACSRTCSPTPSSTRRGAAASCVAAGPADGSAGHGRAVPSRTTASASRPMHLPRIFDQYVRVAHPETADGPRPGPRPEPGRGAGRGPRRAASRSRACPEKARGSACFCPA